MKFSDRKLLELYRQGLTNKEIADRLGVTQASVHYRLQRLGFLNNYRTEDPVVPEEVKSLHNMGLTNVGIALLLQTNVQTISQHLKELGLQDNYYRLTEMVKRG
jgi:DNA-binding NarL/FixJ family response regulator